MVNRILVTGGAGFIGSNLCEALLKQGHFVRCLDNFATGKITNLLSLIEQYPSSFQLIVGDIRKLEDCQKAVEGMEYVLHEAALGSVPRSINDPITTNRVNIDGFLNMLVASRDAGVKRFIFAASSSTYGDSSTLPKVEDVIGKPLSPYAITKYVDELYADVFARTYGMEYIGLRYFNVFGRRQDPHGAYAAVIPLFVKKFMAYESPVINGDGEYSRDFTYIDDIVEGVVRLLPLPPARTPDWDAEHPDPASSSAPWRIFNIGNNQTVELNDFIATLEAALGKKAQRELLPMQPGDVEATWASIDALSSLTGFAPVTPLADGIARFVTWFKEYYNYA